MHFTMMSRWLQYICHCILIPKYAAGIHQVAMMLPVMKSFLEVARPWEADMNATSSLHAYTMCLMRWVAGNTVNWTGELCCTCLVLHTLYRASCALHSVFLPFLPGLMLSAAADCLTWSFIWRI